MYDLVIVGAGPAGLAAAIYSVRYKIDVLVIARETGGMISEAAVVENYPGFRSVKGMELAKKFEEHAKSLGVRIINEEVIGVAKKNDSFTITTNSNKKYDCKSVLLAVGTKRRKLNVPGEGNYLGRGVAYCATCDAPLFKDKVVAVIGGANSAAMSALLLAEHAKKVTVIYRGEKLRADPVLVERLKSNKKIEIMCCANVVKIDGSRFVEGIKLDNGKSLKVQGVFIEVGFVPSLALTQGLGVKTDKDGYVVVSPEQETNVRGVFAAGDITNACAGVKQITTSQAQATVAAFYIYKFLRGGS